MSFAIYGGEAEPRALDTDLARRLGFAKPAKIRDLIERLRADLERFGPLAEVDLDRYGHPLPGATPCGVSPGQVLHGTAPGDSQVPHGGKPDGARAFRGFLLTYEQAILVSIASDAPRAPDVRHEVVTGYMAWKRGQTAEPVPRGPLAILEAMSPDMTLSEVDLAKVLGLSHPSDIRTLVDRRSHDLMRLGAIARVEVRTGGRGRPSKHAMFSRAQCFVLAMAALVQREAPPPVARDGSSAAAAEATRALVALTRRSDAQANDLAKLHDAVQRQAEDLAALRQRLADVEALPARRPADRIAAPTPGDVLGLFLAGCTRQAERGRVQASAIYAAWCDWCRITDLDPGGRRSFGAQLRAFGLRRLKNGVNFYLGLTLLPKDEWARDSTVASGGGEA